jgi:hypothetical protein
MKRPQRSHYGPQTLGPFLWLLGDLCKQIGTRVSELLDLYVSWHTVLDRVRSDNAAPPVEGSAMTESAKRRVTVDVIIPAVGMAIFIVLAIVGAL